MSGSSTAPKGRPDEKEMQRGRYERGGATRERPVFEPKSAKEVFGFAG
jgi:hypothetical protein